MPAIVLVEKSGNLKTLKVKEFKEEEIYKKCGLKNTNNFSKQHTWKVKHSGKRYNISLYAKTESRVADCENKYEFPPPVASCLYFGTCALVASFTSPSPPHLSSVEYTDLTAELWKQICEKLQGGFETLCFTEKEDELEPDELASIPSSKKTKNGYLKDGFVVEGPSDDDDDDESYDPDETDNSIAENELDEDDGETETHITLRSSAKRKQKKQSKMEQQPVNITISITEELKEEPYL